MTRFIESFATQQLLPPWEAIGSQTWGFAIRMKEEKVRDYLAKYFNGGYPDRAPFYYSPLPGPQFGLLSATHASRVGSKNPGTLQRMGVNPMGWDMLSYTETYLAIPVMRHAISADNILTEPTLVWVQPFVFCDNPTAVFSSREIWGTDTNLVTMKRERGLDYPQLHLDTAIVGIKKFAPRSISQLLACLHIRTGDTVAPDLPTMLKGNPDLDAFVRILGGSGVFAGHKPEGVGPSDFAQGVELDNLKQFRDVYNMGAAIYRAIVASRSSHSNVDHVTFFDAAKVDISFLWSDSIAEMLTTILDLEKPARVGPPKGHQRVSPPPTSGEIDWDLDSAPVTAELAFAFTSDVTFEVIGTLHTYGKTA